MLVRLRKVVFNDVFASLFAQIGYLIEDGRFVSQESELVVFNGKPVVNWSDSAVDDLVCRLAIADKPVATLISGESFAIDLTQIEMMAV
jgi:hypothetical protein